MKTDPHPSPRVPAGLCAAAAVLILLATPAGLPGADDPGKSLQQVYNEGRVAFHRGDLAKARESFEAVLRAHPRHQLSQNYLVQIAQAEEARGGNPAMEARLRKIVLDEVSFDEVTVNEAVKYLILLIEKETGGGYKPNILLKDLGEATAARTLTLQLSNIPASEALRFVGELSGVQFEYQQFAIVGTAKSSGGTDAAAAAEPTEPAPSPQKP